MPNYRVICYIEWAYDVEAEDELEAEDVASEKFARDCGGVTPDYCEAEELED